ncbi:MAG: leucine-rich repeat domain-containing protein [Planctomycetota bacterium]|jgi:Leucine-rich repeat (LRR) protein
MLFAKRIVLVLMVVFGAVCSSQAAGAESKERILHFPEERSLGALYVQDENIERRIKTFHYWIDGTEEKWGYLGEATGDVTVPAGKRLSLRVSKTACKDLSPLSVLGPDDLYELSLSFKPASDRCMPHLAGLTGLKVLGLGKTNVTSKGIRFIKEMKSLEHLSLERIGNAGLADVAGLKSLKRLCVWKENLVTNKGLAVLEKLSSLEELMLGGKRIGDDGLVHLAKLPRLSYLSLWGEGFSDAGLAHLKNVPSLKILHIGHLRQITDKGLAHLSDLSNLERLSMHWNENITDKGVKYLSKMKSLKHLDIRNSQVTDKGLAQLAEIKLLEYLQLPSVGITDKGLAYIGKLDKLKYLNVGTSSRSSPISDEGLKHLGKLGCLEELHIGGQGITNRGMGHIVKLTNLRRLVLYGCPSVTNEGLARLMTLKSLEEMNVGSTKITASGLSCLKALPNLTRLWGSQMERGNRVLDISGLNRLEKVDVRLKGRLAFHDDDFACLAKLRHLKRLQLTPLEVTDAGVSYLQDVTSLERLCIGGQDLTDDGLKYLVNMKKLDFLYISDGKITAKGLRYLEGLKALRYLSITSQNAIKPGAVIRLRKKLPNIYTFEVKKNEPDRKRPRIRR